MKVICRISTYVCVYTCMHLFKDMLQCVCVPMAIEKNSKIEKNRDRDAILWTVCILEVYMVFFTPLSNKRVCGFFSSHFVKNQVPWGGWTWLWVLSLVWVTSSNYFYPSGVESFPASLNQPLFQWFQGWVPPCVVGSRYFSGMFVLVDLGDFDRCRSRVSWVGTFPGRSNWVEWVGHRSEPSLLSRDMRRGM